MVHDGAKPFPGVLDALERLNARGKRDRPAVERAAPGAPIGARLAEIGIPPALYDAIHSSGEEVWQHLSGRDDPFYAALGRRCYLIGPPRDEGMLDGLDRRARRRGRGRRVRPQYRPLGLGRDDRGL